MTDNVHALEALYFAQMLEELKAFHVADRLAELFESGMLPIGDRKGAQRLFGEWRSARANAPAGSSGSEPAPNREFADLWIRFLSAVAQLERQPEPIERQVRAVVKLFSHPEIRAAAAAQTSGAARYRSGE